MSKPTNVSPEVLAAWRALHRNIDAARVDLRLAMQAEKIAVLESQLYAFRVFAKLGVPSDATVDLQTGAITYPPEPIEPLDVAPAEFPPAPTN